MHGVSCHVQWATRNRPTAAASGQNDATVDRAVGPWTAITARSAVVSRPPIAARTRSVLEAFGITSNTAGSPPLDGMPPHDDVVEHRTVGVVEEVGVLGPSGLDLRQVVRERVLQHVVRVARPRRARCRGVTRRTSRRRAGRRGARRSSRVYSSGISHPPNGTILAPTRRWTRRAETARGGRSSARAHPTALTRRRGAARDARRRAARAGCRCRL